MLHPFTLLEDSYQQGIIELYLATFTGCDELSVDILLTRELYGVFLDGVLTAFVAFRGPLLEYLAVKTSDRGKGVGGVVVYASIMLCKEKKYSGMYLECKEGLVSYYKRFGAEEIKEGKRINYNSGEAYAQMVVDTH
jgi:hypothetical protein